MAQLKSTNVVGNLSVTGNILASKIIKLGGTSTQILMADGSTINAPSAGLGTVTSVGITSSSLTVTGSPITSSGTITIEHPTATATTADIYKIGKDNKGHVVIGDKITPADLGLSKVYKYKGTKTWAELLALTKAEIGDVYSITNKDPDGNTNADWACCKAVSAACTTSNYSTYWQSLGGKVDLSAYITGSGTANYIPKFTAAGAIGNSVITQSANNDITIAGKLVVKSNGSTSGNSYNEGIRVLPASNGWSELFFSNNQDTSSTHANGWILGKRGAAGATSGAAGDFTIECNGSGGTGLTLYANGNRPRWNNNELAYKSDFGTGGSMDLSNYVDKTTAQTISGIKTFTAQPVISTTNGLKFDSGNCKLRIYNTSASPTDYAAIEVRSNSTSTNRNLFIDLANNSLVVGAASGTADTTYKVNVKGTFNATTIYENGTALSSKYLATNTFDAAIAGTANQLAYFTKGRVIRSSANTKVDANGNIKAASYGIYTDVANNKAATWQYNSSTDCVELMWN